MKTIVQVVTLCDSELCMFSAPPAGPGCPGGGLSLISQQYLLTVCVSCTVIHGRVLRPQTVHLQVQGVLGIVSGDGESALHTVCIIGAATISNFCDPLQPLLWGLADPMHVIVTESESRGYTGEFQGLSRLH